MGTEIEGKGYGYYSMRDVNSNNNEQSSGNNWPILYGEKSLSSTNGEFVVNGFSHRGLVGFDRNTLRQTMLEHEAIFKRQVVELHCLYKIQRDMMDEARRKDVIHKHRTAASMMMMMIPQEASSSSSPFSAWNSPLNKGGSSQVGSKDCEILDRRPTKVRKRLFDLQFNANNNEEEEECSYDVLDYPPKGGDKGFVFLADLNEPTQAEETESISCQIEAKSKSEFLHRLSKETSRRRNEDCVRSNGRGDWSSYNNSDAEHYRNHHLNSSSSSQTLGFLQSEQRREQLHGRKQNPFGIINHKIDWSQSWGNSNQTSLHTNSSLYSSRQLPTTHETLGDKWRIQTGPISNLCFANPLANNNHHHNGFYRGSSSGYKDALAYVSPIEDGGRKQDDHPRLPSWLKPESELKPKNPNSAETSFQQSSSVLLLGNSIPPAPPPPLRKDESSSLASTSASLQPTRELIDINVAYYDPEPEEENKKMRAHIDLNSCITEEEEEEVPIEPIKINLHVPKNATEIDLEEAPPLLLLVPEEDEEEEENAKSAAEAIVLISVSGENDDDDDEEKSMEDPLGWFAEIVVPCEEEEEVMDYFEAVTLSLPEMKAEEYMPKEELVMIGSNYEEEAGGGGGDVVDNNNNKRSRRSTRRGKQQRRRDFQRDILPGLVSLSRHEVSQDIQTFSGLMKATGHTWLLSPRRGGGGGRGRRRRRSVVELGPTEAAAAAAPAEEGGECLQAISGEGGGRSLTVWGKTTLRRPRRQRRLDTSSSSSNLNLITTTTTSTITIITTNK